MDFVQNFARFLEDRVFTVFSFYRMALLNFCFSLEKTNFLLYNTKKNEKGAQNESNFKTRYKRGWQERPSN